jgi:hypothetical protein
MVDKADYLRAATASSEDLVEYFIYEDDATEQGKMN